MEEVIITMGLSTRHSGDRKVREAMTFAHSIKTKVDGSISSEDVEAAVEILAAKVNYLLLNAKARHTLLD